MNGVLGFDKSNVLVAQLNLPERNYSDAETRRRFITDVIDAMRGDSGGVGHRRDQHHSHRVQQHTAAASSRRART